MAIRCRWLLWCTLKNNIVTGQLQNGSVPLWRYFDLQQMGPAAALEIPWYSHQKKKENNTELSASILHPGTVFIWITPPNPLSNDMTQWVTIPRILLWEKHQAFGSERLEMQWKRGEFFKWIFRRTEYWNDYGTSNLQGIYATPTELPWHTYVNCRSWTVLIFLQEDFEKSSKIFTKALSTRMRHAHQTLNTSAWSLPWTRQRERNCSAQPSGGPWRSRCVWGRA